MNFSWALVIIFVSSYLIGSVNFAKILSWQGWHKHIVQEGSGNPGTMNMLRTFGLKAALLNLLLEVVKSGLTAWLCAFIVRKCYAGTIYANYEELVFFFSGLAIVIGSCFPYFGAGKGGKGVACAFGVYVFSKLWYVALILFVIGVIQLYITEYGFISSLIFMVLATVCETICVFVLKVPFAWLICVLAWLICILVLARHYKNFYRIFTHTENKANFRESCKKVFSRKKKVVVAPEITNENEQEIANENEQETTVDDVAQTEEVKEVKVEKENKTRKRKTSSKNKDNAKK